MGTWASIFGLNYLLGCGRRGRCEPTCTLTPDKGGPCDAVKGAKNTLYSSFNEPLEAQVPR